MNLSPDLMESSLKMLTGLVVVVGLLLLIWYLSKQFIQNGGRMDGKRIRVLDNSCIGLKKNISLVQVPGSILVLGITQDRITCLTQISQQDWAENVQKAPVAPRGTVGSFLSELKSEMTGFRNKTNGHRSDFSEPVGGES